MSDILFQNLPNAEASDADVVLLPVPLEHSVSYKTGTRSAPEAILSATDQLEYYEEDAGWCPFKHMRISVLEPLAKRLYEGEDDFFERLQRRTAELPADNLFLALGGEHSVTPAMVSGRMPEPGTVVLLDAHADLRRTFEGSVHSHACPMHHVREQGHDIVMVGIRSIYEEEAERIAADDGIHLYTDRAVQRPDTWQALLEHLGGLRGPAYLTMDMDALDPALASGVGTPQPGGLTWHQTLDILETCFANAAVDWRGFDLVEMIPEPSRVSDMTAAKVLQKVISFWGRARGYPARPATGPQTEVDYD